jgi:6-pyruvoyl-tetrahydropterin synthase
MSDNLLRNFTHITIPAEIWLRQDISLQAKCLWAEMRSLHDKEKGGCYASDEYLSQFLGLKRSRLQEVIKELKDASLLVVVSFNGRQTIRRAIVPETEYQTGQQLSGKPDSSHPENRTADARKTGFSPYIENKGEDKDKSPPLSQRLASFFFDELRKINPKVKKPDFAKWSSDFDLMLSKDGNSEEDIRRVILYLMSTKNKESSNGFKWCKVILSASKLRDKFASLWAEMEDIPIADLPVKNKELARFIEQKFPRPDISVGPDYIEFINGPKAIHVKFDDKKFKEIVMSQLEIRKIKLKDL